MTAPLYDKGGRTVPDPADGALDNAATNALADDVMNVAFEDRLAYVRAVNVHWNAIHFGDGGDNIALNVNERGRMELQYFTPWSG